MKALTITLVCGTLLLTGCIKDKGNSILVTTTGSINKTRSGETYMDLDLVELSATNTELQKGDWEIGDRILTTAQINLDNQENPIINGVYNATITSIKEFDCKSCISSPYPIAYQSDTLPALFSVNPFLIHRAKDDIITLSYTMLEDGELDLVQPRPFDLSQGMQSDTLYIVYKKGEKASDKTESNYISFKLPQYPVNNNVQVVVRFNALNQNLTMTIGDKVSKMFSFIYYREEKL